MASLLVCADIFGVAPDLEEWVKEINPFDECALIDAYDTRVDFNDEKAAYAWFVECGGIDAYVKKIILNIERYQPTIILGFSAGAASAYKALCSTNNPIDVHKLIGFYPGQIRYFTDLSPNTDCTLYFPYSEPHFSVDSVVDELHKHKNVYCQKTKYKHGFMNQKSSGYAAKGHIEFTELLKIQLQKILV